MKLIYGITVSTEIDEIKRLLSFLKSHTTDPIIVQYDATKVTENLLHILKDYDVNVIGFPFNNDFSEFKNQLSVVAKALGGDYIFQLDADEMISEYMVKSIKSIIEMNPNVDLFSLPRINTVEGLTHDHIYKWGWYLNNRGYINFPDFQGRIYRSDMMWFGNVHEKIVGSKNSTLFPEEEIYCIQHHKTIKKQESQIMFYNTLK